jgi:hypothetical protein
MELLTFKNKGPRFGLFDNVTGNEKSLTEVIENMSANNKKQNIEVYYSDYPNEPIGGDNPYYCCSYCKRSDPEINGRLEKHSEYCEYRLKKEKELKAVRNK